MNDVVSEVQTKPGHYGIIIEIDGIEGRQWVVNDKLTIKAMLDGIEEAMIDLATDLDMEAIDGDDFCFTLLGEAVMHMEEIKDDIRRIAGLTDEDSLSIYVTEPH